jgi:DNA-binding response OmpR family regulator
MPRILLIEDDHDMQLVMQHVLLDEQYKVDATKIFEGGSELLAHLDYDLVLADGRLPNGTGMRLAD